MNMLKTFAAAAAFTFAAVTAQAAAPVVGQPAPAFTGTTSDGETIELSQFAGRTVVLEWINPSCPFVRKHYDSENMQGVQIAAAEGGVVWLAVQSTNPEHKDYETADDLTVRAENEGWGATFIVLDDDGTIGKAYDAKTTPHMYIVDGEGVLRYAGAIDDKPSARPDSLEGATNYVTAALGDLAEGRAVATAETTAYGCSVKY